MNIETLKPLLGISSMYILAIFMYLTERFKKQKKVEYKNDERWQVIRLKANQMILRYFYILGIVICISLATVLVLNLKTEISLTTVVQVLFYGYLFQNPIEYYSLKYFDQEI